MLDFWDRNHYTGSGSQLDADANGSDKLGLAEWSNGNFLGEDVSYAEYFSTSSFHYFPHPALADTDQPQLTAHTYTQILDNLTLANGKQDERAYLEKTSAGLKVKHHSALHYIAVRHSPKISTQRMYAATTINDPNVLGEYHTNFIPKAIEYSAGILDYFFRGTLGVNPLGSTNGTYGITITNTSTQDLFEGDFHLFYDDTNGVRTELMMEYGGFYTDYSDALAAGGTVNASFSVIRDAVSYILVYQGTIGTSGGTVSDPVDAEIAIAAKNFIPPTIDWTLPVGQVDTAYTGSITGKGFNDPTFSIISGALPGGLSLNATNGAITGTPTVSDYFFFTVQVTDGLTGATCVKFLSVAVATGLWDLTWGSPVDNSFNVGTFSATPLTTNGWATDANCLSYSGSGDTSGGRGQITGQEVYAGPSADCNLQFIIGGTNLDYGWDGHIKITQDGETVFEQYINSWGAGEHNWSFTINGDYAGLIVVEWDVQVESDFGSPSDAIDATATAHLTVLP